nr:WG repeat-containing protein [uncultured Flavobacterium sp.]
MASGKFIAIDGVDKIWDFLAQDLTYARKNDKIGFVDLNGNWVIDPKFDKAKAFNKNLAPVLVGNKWGYIDMKGNLVIDPVYNDAEVFSADGLAPVKDKNWGFINTTGKLVIPTQYGITAGGIFSIFKDDQKGFVKKLARVKNESKWGFLKLDGSVLGNQWFENAEPFQK